MKILSKKELASRIDLALLKPNLNLDAALHDYRKYGFRCLAVPTSLLPLIPDDIRKCVVLNFPYGFDHVEVLEKAISFAAENNAFEVDFVADPRLVLNGQYERYGETIAYVVRTCREYGLNVKVIVEAPLLSDDQLKRACKVIANLEDKPDYVKTSTGLHRPASPRDVLMCKAYSGLPVKAAGGIKHALDAMVLINLGAALIGTSSGAALMESYDEAVAILKTCRLETENELA